MPPKDELPVGLVPSGPVERTGLSLPVQVAEGHVPSLRVANDCRRHRDFSQH